MTYCSFFHWETPGCTVIAILMVQKWAWFDPKWAWSNIVYARYAHDCMFSPPNLQYLPTPMVYLSPCFRLINCFGNSCWHTRPKMAVSSKALYRDLDHSASSASDGNPTLSEKCIHLKCHNFKKVVWTLGDILGSTSYFKTKSTISWSSKYRVPNKGGRTLLPAAFLRHRPNKASNNSNKVPFFCHSS